MVKNDEPGGGGGGAAAGAAGVRQRPMPAYKQKVKEDRRSKTHARVRGLLGNFLNKKVGNTIKNSELALGDIVEI